MTTAELQNKMQLLGLNAGQFAAELGVHPNHLRAVLRGERPLTGKLAVQVESYISHKDNELKHIAVVFSVALPDLSCSYHLHAPEKLTDTERQQVMQAVKAKIEAVSGE